MKCSGTQFCSSCQFQAYIPPTGWWLFSTLITEATSPLETLITTFGGTRCHNPENHNLTIHSRGIQQEDSFPWPQKPATKRNLRQLNPALLLKSRFPNTVFPRATRGLGGVITACWVKPRYANLREKSGYVNADTYGTLSPAPLPNLKLHTFLDSKHAHSAWVADAASFVGAERITARVYPQLFSVQPNFSPIYIYIYIYI